MTHSAILQKFNINIVGQGEPTLVMAHGFGSDQTAWRHQVASFSPDHRVVLFDHLGCGKADVSDYHPRRYSSLERYAEDVLQIYEALELTDTVYIGHSAGAMIGLLASLALPSAFRSLVLVGVTPRLLDDGDYKGGFTQDDLNSLYAVMARDYLGWANGFAPTVMSNGERPELGREFARTLGSMRPNIAQSVARVLFESDIRDRLSRVTQPVLVLQPRQDSMVSTQVAEYVAAQLPRGQLRILDAQGHLPHLSAPSEVTVAIRSFLAA
jgi:sigma-B regulation protein RsbQ